jgi:hypothetical protein
MTLDETQAGFPKAQLFYLTFPDGDPVLNLKTADGTFIRQELSRGQLATVVIDALPHVVRV